MKFRHWAPTVALVAVLTTVAVLLVTWIGEDTSPPKAQPPAQPASSAPLTPSTSSAPSVSPTSAPTPTTALKVARVKDLQADGWTRVTRDINSPGDHGHPSGAIALGLLQRVYAEEAMKQDVPLAKRLEVAGEIIESTQLRAAWHATSLQAWDPPEDSPLDTITAYTDGDRLALLAFNPFEEGRVLYVAPEVCTIKQLRNSEVGPDLNRASENMELLQRVILRHQKTGLKLNLFAGYWLTPMQNDPQPTAA